MTRVQLYDSQKRPIDFEQDEGTKSKLLRAIGGFHAVRCTKKVPDEEPGLREPRKVGPQTEEDVVEDSSIEFEAAKEDPYEVEPLLQEEIGEEDRVKH